MEGGQSSRTLDQFFLSLSSSSSGSVWQPPLSWQNVARSFVPGLPINLAAWGYTSFLELGSKWKRVSSPMVLGRGEERFWFPLQLGCNTMAIHHHNWHAQSWKLPTIYWAWGLFGTSPLTIAMCWVASKAHLGPEADGLTKTVANSNSAFFLNVQTQQQFISFETQTVSAWN